MKNPYHILKVSQNATNIEIAQAFVMLQKENIKTKEYTAQEIMTAQKQLLNPAKRLVADYLYPSKFKSKRPKRIIIKDLKADRRIDINSINENAFDSLKYEFNYED
ncbi:MAG: hypothetical protein IIA45_08755 [Bacteroidetes bacterium]|nr:hypothetical protein [Bacteroidota bacterium]